MPICFTSLYRWSHPAYSIENLILFSKRPYLIGLRPRLEAEMEVRKFFIGSSNHFPFLVRWLFIIYPSAGAVAVPSGILGHRHATSNGFPLGTKIETAALAVICLSGNTEVNASEFEKHHFYFIWKHSKPIFLMNNVSNYLRIEAFILLLL